MIGTMINAFVSSDPSDLTKLYDSSGNVCGHGATKDYPILYLEAF